MASSETILTQQAHPGDSSTQSVTGTAYKGDGYYSRTDGLHTIQYNLDGFIGTIEIQATLATSPGVDDWFTVTNTVHTATADDSSNARDGSFLYNFTGNYVWVRAVAEYTDGTIKSVTLNH